MLLLITQIADCLPNVAIRSIQVNTARQYYASTTSSINIGETQCTWDLVQQNPDRAQH